MKHILYTTIGALACAGLMWCQNAGNPLSSEMKTGYETVKRNLMGATEKMPEENYSFKPTPEIRSFAEVLGHVAVSQTRVCGAVLGEHKQAPEAGATKASVTAALQQSFAVCDRAFEGLNDVNGVELMNTSHGQRTRIGVLGANVVHDTEQYGILSVYLRLKGIVPPSSEPAPRKP